MTDLSQPMVKKVWSQAEVEALFDLPLNDLLFQAQGVHRQHFDANAVQLSTLLSIKTGGCSEDCGYCSQSARHDTGLERERLLEVSEVVDAAKAAKEAGAARRRRTWPSSRPWCARSRPWGWRPASPWAC
jgi:biotin synthase-like enzyme